MNQVSLINRCFMGISVVINYFDKTTREYVSSDTAVQ